MDEEKEIIENAIYAIVGMNKIDIDSLEEYQEYELIKKGINGTCFFIEPNKFITAHHCLSHTFANEQIYFLINKNGHIISGIHIESEDSKTDLCVGKINSSLNTYCKISNKTSINAVQKYTAYGFSSSETQNFRIKVVKENNIIRIVENDSLTLKKVEYNCINSIFLKSHISKDLNPIHLVNCNVLIFNKSLELGFSGGPTFNDTNEVIGFTSQDIFCSDSSNPFNLVIPI